MKVSVIIPARNELFLAQTVRDVLGKATGEVEVIVILDGYWPQPILEDDKRLTLIHPGKARGMRWGINAAASVAKCEENIDNGLYVEKGGYTNKMGFEPGTHGRNERIDDYKAEAWMSAFPNIDIRHNKNLTPSRWRQEQFRDKRNCRGWTEAEEVPGWGRVLEGLSWLI